MGGRTITITMARRQFIISMPISAAAMKKTPHTRSTKAQAMVSPSLTASDVILAIMNPTGVTS